MVVFCDASYRKRDAAGIAAVGVATWTLSGDVLIPQPAWVIVARVSVGSSSEAERAAVLLARCELSHRALSARVLSDARGVDADDWIPRSGNELADKIAGYARTKHMQALKCIGASWFGDSDQPVPREVWSAWNARDARGEIP